MRRVTPIAQRFWSKVDKSGPVPAHSPELGPCWVWTASLNRKGYGQIHYRAADAPKRPAAAHRISWMLAHGGMPALCVLHKCDNPRCVRPDHLFVGTVAENNEDMRAKGRDNPKGFTREDLALAASALPRGDKHYSRTNPERLARGERHPRTHMTVEKVVALREAYAAGVPVRELRARYSLSEPAVYAILARRNWAHVA